MNRTHRRPRVKRPTPQEAYLLATKLDTAGVVQLIRLLEELVETRTETTLKNSKSASLSKLVKGKAQVKANKQSGIKLIRDTFPPQDIDAVISEISTGKHQLKLEHLSLEQLRDAYRRLAQLARSL